MRYGFVWVDVPAWDDEAARAGTAARRAPRGEGGHVHLLELDVLLADRSIVTVHGPLNRAVAQEAAGREVASALRRIDEGRFRPSTPADVLHDLLGALGRHHGEVMNSVVADVAQLEPRVREGDLRNPEPLLDEMFLLRHELQVVLTVAAQTQELLAYVATTRQGAALRPQALELAAQFGAVRRGPLLPGNRCECDRSEASPPYARRSCAAEPKPSVPSR